MANPLVINFGNIPDNVVPDGKYVVEIETAENSIAVSSGNLMCKLRGRIIEGPSTGRVLFDKLMLQGSEESLAISKGKLKAAGVDVSGEVAFTPDMLIGLRAIWTTKQKEYEGNLQAEVKSWRRLRDEDLLD